MNPDDCGHRPCPDRQCRYALPAGRCLWDVLEEHPEGMTLEQIGAIFGVKRQTIEAIERKALERVQRTARSPLDTYQGRLDPYGR